MKILYAAAEISPFAKMSNTADLLRFLPASLQDKGYEIRILLPKYGSINDRRNRLHEVIRLAGIEVHMEDRVEAMKIKVASIPNAKLQVYFLDNDTYFKRKAMFHDPKNNEFYHDNAERLAFYSKGVLETIKRLGWMPEIIHCHDWSAGLIPMLVKKVYNEFDNFKSTKVVYNLHSPLNPGNFGDEIFRFLNLPDGFDTDSIKTNGLVDPIRAGLTYADHVVTGNDMRDDTLQNLYPDLKPEIYKIQGAPQDVSQKFSDYYKLITGN